MKVFLDGEELEVESFNCIRKETGEVINVSARNVKLHKDQISLYAARRESGTLLLFASMPVREVSPKRMGKYGSGSWRPQHGWSVELRENKLQNLPEVTWNRGAVAVELSIPEFEIKE